MNDLGFFASSLGHPFTSLIDTCTFWEISNMPLAIRCGKERTLNILIPMKMIHCKDRLFIMLECTRESSERLIPLYTFNYFILFQIVNKHFQYTHSTCGIPEMSCVDHLFSSELSNSSYLTVETRNMLFSLIQKPNTRILLDQST